MKAQITPKIASFLNQAYCIAQMAQCKTVAYDDFSETKMVRDLLKAASLPTNETINFGGNGVYAQIEPVVNDRGSYSYRVNFASV
jgi:hypothetical protein